VTTPPETSLTARIDAAIRPNMLLGLQDAELDGPGGTKRIGEWAGWIAATVAETVQPELDAARAERNAFADRLDTLTTVAEGNKRHVQEMYIDLLKARSELAAMVDLRDRAIARQDQLRAELDEMTKARDAAKRLAARHLTAARTQPAT
jgi:hypothetical protein